MIRPWPWSLVFDYSIYDIQLQNCANWRQKHATWTQKSQDARNYFITAKIGDKSTIYQSTNYEFCSDTNTLYSNIFKSFSPYNLYRYNPTSSFFLKKF
jgi:hypothetical protein